MMTRCHCPIEINDHAVIRSGFRARQHEWNLGVAPCFCKIYPMIDFRSLKESCQRCCRWRQSTGEEEILPAVRAVIHRMFRCASERPSWAMSIRIDYIWLGSSLVCSISSPAPTSQWGCNALFMGTLTLFDAQRFDLVDEINPDDRSTLVRRTFDNERLSSMIFEKSWHDRRNDCYETSD